MLKNYSVRITETMYKEYIIQAESEDAARDYAEHKYYAAKDPDYILSADNINDMSTVFSVKEVE